MIKNYNEFVAKEFDNFYRDFETSKKKLKLFTKFGKIKADSFNTNFTLSKLKKKFQPKIKNFKKINNDKGIF